jgi:hypothetical protein
MSIRDCRMPSSLEGTTSMADCGIVERNYSGNSGKVDMRGKGKLRIRKEVRKKEKKNYAEESKEAKV